MLILPHIRINSTEIDKLVKVSWKCSIVVYINSISYKEGWGHTDGFPRFHYDNEWFEWLNFPLWKFLKTKLELTEVNLLVHSLIRPLLCSTESASVSVMSWQMSTLREIIGSGTVNWDMFLSRLSHSLIWFKVDNCLQLKCITSVTNWQQYSSTYPTIDKKRHKWHWKWKDVLLHF